MSEISSASAPKKVTPESSSQDSLIEVSDGISLEELKLPWESWHTYFMGGKKIGHTHVLSELDEEGGVGNVITTVVDQLTMRRGASTFQQSLFQTSIERPDGSLISFNADLRVGPARTRFNGRVDLNTLTVDTIRGGMSQSESIPWSPQYRGFAAVQQTLLAKPIKLNDKRRIDMLAPMFYRVANIEMNCRHRASISTMDGMVHDALEVDVSMIVGTGNPIESTVWVDEMGELLKSYTPSIDLISIRSSKADAEAAVVSATADLLSLTSLTVTGSLDNPQETYRAGYLLRPRGIDGKEKMNLAIEPQLGQWFRKLDDGTIQLLVSRDPSESARSGFIGLQSKPDIKDTQSGPIIDNASPSVRKLASLSKATKTRDIAIDLTRTVKQLIGPGDFTRGFATASQTAQDSVGDCSERAVLLAAMLRSRDIPARVAAGLVYVGPKDKPVMAYHMWTLAWIDDAWVALDPTSGGLAPADRIAFATSNLADGNEYSFVAPIMSAMSRMEIEITTAKYQSLE
jgi:transglutaminase-like putative cysteine protease